MGRAARLELLIAELRRAGVHGRTAEQLGHTLGVSPRTVRRDVEVLLAEGVAIWAQPGAGGGYYSDPSDTLPPLTLSPRQAVGLRAAVTLAPDIPYAAETLVALDTLDQSLPPSLRVGPRDAGARLWVDPPQRTPISPARAVAEAAVISGHVLRLTYAAADGAITHRDVEPQALAHTEGGWYLLAWCRLRDAPRWFELDRIRHARALSERVLQDRLDGFGGGPT